MPQLPGPETLGGVPTPEVGSGVRVATVGNAGAVGQAAYRLGQTMEQAALELHDSWKQNDAVSNAARYEKMKTDNEMAFTQSVTQAMPDASLGATPAPPPADPLAPSPPAAAGAGGAPGAAAAAPAATPTAAPAAGFTSKTIADFTATGRAFLDTIADPKERAKYALQLMADRESIFNRAYGHESVLRDQQALITANAGMQPVLANLAMEARRVVADPTVDDKGKADALARAKAASKNLLDSTPGLLPGKRIELQATMERAINGTFMESLTPPEQARLVQQKGSPAALGDPAGGKAAVSAYLGKPVSDADYELLLKLVHGESDGDPTESAMIAATVLNRSLKRGQSISKVIYDTNQFQAATGTSADGHAPNSNFVAGPKGKARVTIEGALAGILGGVDHNQDDFTAAKESAYKAGTDVGYLHKMQREGGMVIGGTIFNTKGPTAQPVDTSGTTDQYFDKNKPAPVGAPYGLEAANFDDRQKYATLGENKLAAAANQERTDAATARTQNVADVHDNIMHGIITGEITDKKTIDESGLPIKEQNSLLEKLISTNADAVKTGAALTRFANGEIFNPLVAKDVADSSRVYKAMGGAARLFDPDGKIASQSAAVLNTIVRQAHIIPAEAMDEMRNRSNSTNPADVERAGNLVHGFLADNPNAFAGYGDGTQLKNFGTAFDTLLENGKSGADAAKMLIDKQKPENILAEATLKTAADAFEKTLKVEDITGPLTSGGFLGIGSTTPMAGYTPGLAAGMLGFYQDSSREHYVNPHDPGYGDPLISKAEGRKDTNKVFGVSMVSGEPVMMKYPPEHFYPPVDGKFDYMTGAANHQSMADYTRRGFKSSPPQGSVGAVTGFGGVTIPAAPPVATKPSTDTPDIIKSWLVATPDTANDIRQGRPDPRYELHYAHYVDGQVIVETAIDAFHVPADQIKAANAAVSARDDAAARANEPVLKGNIKAAEGSRAGRLAADAPVDLNAPGLQPLPAPVTAPVAAPVTRSAPTAGVNPNQYSDWQKAQPSGTDMSFGAYQRSLKK